MNLNWAHVVLAVVGVAVGFAVGTGARPSPARLSNDPVEALDDCLVTLMHGQPGVMFGTIQSICARRFVNIEREK